MNLMETVNKVQEAKVKEDFNWGAAIGVMVLLLMFIGATFYVLISSLKDLG